MAYLFAVFGESIMAENVITDKVVGESGDSNSNAIDQSQIVESQGGKKDLVRGIIFSRKTDSDGNEKGVCNYCKKEYFLLIQKNMVRRQCLLIYPNALRCLITLILDNQD
uniref:BED-type domain-containing protein n=1 Tax=Solanum lycopersicum TaxID=4081 RepID=A0A3Q7J6U8_SOLLC